jgi:hypothetical protein
MLKFIANLFGVKPTAPTAPAPYKVETPAEQPVAVAPQKAAKKPAVKKATTRKPKTPKA